MKPKDIKVGVTYVNRGAGRTRRKVLGIGEEHRPNVFFTNDGAGPDGPGVLYEQAGFKANLSLSSFAQWCGKVAPKEKHR